MNQLVEKLDAVLKPSMKLYETSSLRAYSVCTGVFWFPLDQARSSQIIIYKSIHVVRSTSWNNYTRTIHV